jgi:hypothetical protein
MLRSFFGQKLVIVALSIATTMAFATVVVPALGGPTAFSVKKKVKRGPPGPQGPAGPQGPQGPQGAQGAQGNAGAPATKLWAVVQGNGTLTRGSGTSGTDEKHGDGTGIYDVIFNQDVSQCSFQATDVSSEHFWWAEPGFQGSNSVRVVAHNTATVAEDAPFNLAVFC